jgi:hypothetical protein
MASYYIYKDCDTNFEYSSSTIVDESLTINGVYQLEITDGGTPITSCFTILTGDSGSYSSITLSESFDVCFNCLINLPKSANTETIVCVETCTAGTFTEIVPPHPVWTDGYGKPITQLNAITLGGPNGLNS